MLRSRSAGDRALAQLRRQRPRAGNQLLAGRSISARWTTGSRQRSWLAPGRPLTCRLELRHHAVWNQALARGTRTNRHLATAADLSYDVASIPAGGEADAARRSGMQSTYSPLRTLRDVEELERVPLEQRVFSWNLNDWIARGCALDPDKIAIQYVADGNPDRQPVAVTYRELRTRSNQAANLFHSLGVSGGDAVLFLLPNVPELFVVMLGSLAAGIACSVNWMLKPEQLGELIRSTKAKVIVALGPTPGYEIWENVQAIRARHPRIGAHSLRARSGRSGAPESDLDTLASRHPGDKLVFERKVAPDDIAAYIHSGGTTGSPKLVKLTHRGFAYKCWANAVVMAHHRRRRDLRRIPDVPYRRHFRQALVRDRARHVDRNPLAARRPRQAVHRQLLEVCRALRRHDLLRACRRPWRNWRRASRRAKGWARCATTPAPARPPSRPRSRARSRR